MIFLQVLLIRWEDGCGKMWSARCPDECALILPVRRDAHDATRAGLAGSTAYAADHVMYEQHN